MLIFCSFSDRASAFPKTSSQLVVMSDPYTVVDQSGEGRSGLDRVRTMVFSPDGTKLGKNYNFHSTFIV